MKKLLLVLVAFSVWSCKKADTDATYSVDSTAESGQQVGDAMAAIDESGGSTSGAITQNEIKSYERAFARLAQDDVSNAQAAFFRIFPQAQAAACGAVSFDACGTSGANKRVRTLDGCSTSLGGAMSGNVSLTFAGTGASSCTIPVANDTVSRVPSFSITGLRGATFSVSATSTGQTLKRTGATTFDFSNTGIRRTFVTPKGSTILDVTTTVSSSSPLTVTGNSRANRVVNGGPLVVVNNLTGVTCNLTASSVSWSTGCSCPTAGSWSGTCSDSTTFTTAFSSTCGQATVTKGTESSTVTLDRCQ